MNPVGTIESVTDQGVVTGWLQYPLPLDSQPSKVPFRVNLIVDGALALPITCTEFRDIPSRLDSGDENFASGFRIRIPQPFFRANETSNIMLIADQGSVRVAEPVQFKWASVYRLNTSVPALYVDILSPEGVVGGWAWDPAAPDRRLLLAMYIDGVFIGQTWARRPRLDLVAANIGEGSYGFDFVVPWLALQRTGPKIFTILSVDDDVLLYGPVKLELAYMKGVEERIADVEFRLDGIEQKLSKDQESYSELKQQQSLQSLFVEIGTFFQALGR